MYTVLYRHLTICGFLEQSVQESIIPLCQMTNCFCWKVSRLWEQLLRNHRIHSTNTFFLLKFQSYYPDTVKIIKLHTGHEVDPLKLSQLKVSPRRYIFIKTNEFLQNFGTHSLRIKPNILNVKVTNVFLRVRVIAQMGIKQLIIYLFLLLALDGLSLSSLSWGSPAKSDQISATRYFF